MKIIPPENTAKYIALRLPKYENHSFEIEFPPWENHDQTFHSTIDFVYDIYDSTYEVLNEDGDAFFDAVINEYYEADFVMDPDISKSEDCRPIESMKMNTDMMASFPDCRICLSPYTKDEEVSLPACHHPFHQSCLVSWLQLRFTCPLCRARIR